MKGMNGCCCLIFIVFYSQSNNSKFTVPSKSKFKVTIMVVTARKTNFLPYSFLNLQTVGNFILLLLDFSGLCHTAMSLGGLFPQSLR